MSTQALLVSLFEYKMWANDALFRTLASFPTQVDGDIDGDKRVLATRLLNHTFVVDQIFAANLEQRAHGFSALNTPDTPALSDLQRAVSAQDQWFLNYVCHASDEALNMEIDFTFVDGSQGAMTRQAMLAHLITHGNYHRGMVGRILNELGATAPRDAFTVFLHS